ncbi:hypothetical protein POM88_000235 [Heracleum sosnowskyi]|uniref:Ubiquitin-like domain-containing protein n=1 Tax=Heracleum sosnowskyi TaxID=360622 RepID=A0AAD8JDV7_9APIA|nr:hypothetical protein POM88_000235 [Heracleum sosnowskyi]
MVFIKTLEDDVLLKLDVDPTSTTLSTLKREIANKWTILPMIQQLYLGMDYGLDSEEIIGNPSMRIRDQGGDQLSISQLGVQPCSTLLLLGPVFKPASFFESDDAVFIARRQLKRAGEMKMEQGFNSVMMKKKLKMA